MDQKTALAAAKFLLRADLKGAEVPAFDAVMRSLERIINAKPAAAAAPAPDAAADEVEDDAEVEVAA